METPAAPSAADLQQTALIQKKLVLANSFRRNITWFYWLAGLSIINSIISLFGGSITFLFGLGVTQVVDGFIFVIQEELGANAILPLVGFFINLVIALFFVLFGYLGLKGKRWAIITGLVLYLLDGLLVLFFADYLGAIFHLWVIFSLAMGLKTLADMKKLEGSPSTLSYQSQQSFPIVQQDVTSPWFKTLKIVMIIVAPIIILLIFILSRLN